MYRGEDGEVQITETGDDLIDQWEEQLARGEVPDLTAAFNKESLEALKARKGKVKDNVFAPSIADVVKGFEAQQSKLNAEFNNTPPNLGPTFKRGK